MDKEQAEAIISPESEHMLVNTQSETSPGKIKPATSHLCNFRSRIESTHSKTRE